LSAVGAVGWLQFAQPVTQYESHVPPEHDSAATFAELHARPHAPQWLGFDTVLVSQPSSAVGALG
jgi:hypothetical protein